MRGVRRNETSSGTLSLRPRSNTMLKSMCTTDPLRASSSILSKCRSPKPRRYPTCSQGNHTSQNSNVMNTSCCCTQSSSCGSAAALLESITLGSGWMLNEAMLRCRASSNRYHNFPKRVRNKSSICTTSMRPTGWPQSNAAHSAILQFCNSP